MAIKNSVITPDDTKNVTAFRKATSRSVLEFEARLANEEIIEILGIAEKLRKIENETRGKMKKQLDQMRRTKKYRKLISLLATMNARLEKNPTNDAAKKLVAIYKKELSELRGKYNLSLYACYTLANFIRKKYDGVNASFAYSVGDNVWAGISDVLFGDGEKLHFAKRSELPILRGRMFDRDIKIKLAKNDNENKSSDDRIEIFFGKHKIKFGRCDDYQREALARIASYLKNASVIDEIAVGKFGTTGEITDTYRPCYAALVPKKIRNRWRIFVQITYEGNAIQSERAKSRKLANGVVGVDIGTQTIAYTSDGEVGLKNLAERGTSIKNVERELWLIQRKMDRSRRATNPEYYNADGTIKKGKKHWRRSKNYMKLQSKCHELHRKAAINRHLAVNEDVNHLRTLGDTVITEPQNYAGLARKAKKPTDGSVRKTAKGKCAKRKRFGKSIQNRCPGYFHSRLKYVFEHTGGLFIEVDGKNYRASQYDHTDGQYKKKSLSTRMYNLADGSRVQRDWYSSLLLYCYDFGTGGIDSVRVGEVFGSMFARQNQMIQDIVTKKIRILNSGIRFPA